jgi:hypothetical protein
VCVIVLSGRTRLADNEQQAQSDLQLVSCPDGVRGVAPRSSGLDAAMGSRWVRGCLTAHHPSLSGTPDPQTRKCRSMTVRACCLPWPMQLLPLWSASLSRQTPSRPARPFSAGNHAAPTPWVELELARRDRPFSAAPIFRTSTVHTGCGTTPDSRGTRLGLRPVAFALSCSTWPIDHRFQSACQCVCRALG